MGNSVIGAVRVNLGLDSASYDAGLAKARTNLKSFGTTTRLQASAMKELTAGFQSTASKAGPFGSALAGMGIAGVAAGAAIGGVAVAMSQARKAFAFGDEIGDAAAKIGVSSKALQEYRYAVHQLGGEYKDADAALEGFSKAFGAAEAGLSKRAGNPFKALGLDPKAYKSTEEALQAVIGKISQLSSTAEQAAIADKLGLTPMLPALRAGALEIENLRAAANRLGFVMDDALIQKASTANDRMQDLGQVIAVQVNGAFVNLAPQIVHVGEAFAELTRHASEAARDMPGIMAELQKTFAGQLAFGPETPKDSWVNKADAKIASFVKGKAKQMALSGGISGLLAGKAQDLSGMAPDKEDRAKTRLVNLVDEARASAAAGKAASGHAAELKQLAAERQRETEASTRYIESLQEELLELGKTPRQLALLRADREAAKAPTEALAEAILKNARALEDERAVLTLLEGPRAKFEEDMRAHAEVMRILRDRVAEGLEPLETLERVLLDVERAGLKAFQPLALEAMDFSGIDAMNDHLRDVQDTANEALGDIQNNIGDLFASMNDRNWAGAAMNVANAFKSIAAAAKGAGGMPTALATGAAAVGSTIGGKTGGALMGAASGAMGGMSLVASLAAAGTIIPGIGNVAGAAIGAVLGGISSLFGGSSKKKAAAEAKAKAEEDARQQELQRQAQIAATLAQQRIDLLRAEGKEEEAVALEHEAVLAQLRPLGDELVANQQKLWDLAAAAKAAADAADAAAAAIQAQAAAQAARTELETQFSNLFETEAQKLATAQKTVVDTFAALQITAPATAAGFQDLVLGLATVDASSGSAYETLLKIAPAFRAVADAAEVASQKMLADAKAATDAVFQKAQDNEAERQAAIEEARSALANAFGRDSSVLKSAIEGLNAWRDTLAKFGDQLRLNPINGLTANLREARQQFEQLLPLLATNDNARGQYMSAAQTLIDASAGAAGSREDAARDLAKVRIATNKAALSASTQITVAEKQLSALEASVAGLLPIAANTKNTEQAIRDLADAMGFGKKAGPIVPMNPATGLPTLQHIGGVDSVDFLDGRTDAEQLADWFKAYAGLPSNSTTDVAKWVDLATGTPYARDEYGQPIHPTGFATGGSFTVGGTGGVDSQMRALALTPGERVSVDRPGDIASHSAAINGLRNDFQQMQNVLIAIKLDTGRTSRATGAMNKDGVWARGQVPGDPAKVEAA